ncbi:MAG: GTPase HflX [Candidatus Margulisiibacteriota bacterium]
MQNIPEKALLIGVEFGSDSLPLDLSMSELKSLAYTAGLEIVGEAIQKRDRPDPAYFIGTGKIEEIKTLIAQTNADVVIMDHAIKPMQQRNLEEFLETKVIDRTEIILDIFAQHAKSREGRLQVDLAQNTYLLTRLTGQGKTMSRLGGGVGTRGPGETKLEVDRRKIRLKVSQLKREIEQIRKARKVGREMRQKSGIPLIAIIGYTNSGKSTLLNALTRSDVLVENKLFATLDPTTRRLYLPSGKTVLATDTVGFIHKLPHQLVAAFRATLEEATQADLLLHVVDASSSYFEAQINSVYGVLEELGGILKPIITVFNKVDLLDKKPDDALLKKYKPAVLVSASKKEGLDELLSIISDRLL